MYSTGFQTRLDTLAKGTSWSKRLAPIRFAVMATLRPSHTLLWSYLTLPDTHNSFPHGDQSDGLQKLISQSCRGCLPIFIHLYHWHPVMKISETGGTLKMMRLPCIFGLNRIRNWMKIIARSYCADFWGTNGHLYRYMLKRCENS